MVSNRRRIAGTADPPTVKSGSRQVMLLAADDSPDVVCDSLPVHHGTSQFFVLLDRWHRAHVAGVLNRLSDPNDIDARAAFKIQGMHQAVDVLHVHGDPPRTVGAVISV